MEDACSICQLPKGSRSLKGALEFCSRLTTAGTFDYKKFTNMIKTMKLDVGDFHYYEYYFDTPEGSLAKTIDICHSLRKKILGADMLNEYEIYNAEFKRECIGHYLETFERILPQLFGTLYFMYFMCDRTECGVAGCGGWSTSSTISSYEPLIKWLTDNNKPLERQKHKSLVGGFRDSDIKGKDPVDSLFSKETDSSWLISAINDGHLQRLMVPMIFLKEWHRGKTAHTLLFLKQFIHLLHDRIKLEVSGIPNFDEFYTACNSCHVSIQMLFEKLYPVCKENTKLYHAALRTDEQSFSLYYNWIKENVEPLIKSLEEMEHDSKQWKQDNLIRGKSYGPFPWGFVFRDTSWVNGQYEKEVCGVFDLLITDLKLMLDVISVSEKGASSTGVLSHTEAADSTSISSYATRVATVVALGALFFSIWYLLNI